VDLVISDIFMPESDGLELLRALRKRAPELKVIAISGGGNLGNMDILHAARLFGAYRVFTKPFATEDLLLAVREALADGAPPAAQ
jgi:DNA-binding NtrC family response regulator